MEENYDGSDTCIGCSCDVSVTNKAKRRSISSDKSVELRTVLCELDLDLVSLLSKIFRNVFVCHKCEVNIQKVLKLREKISEVQESLSQ